MISRILSAAFIGFESRIVEIEVDVTRGMSAVVMVGLPDASVKESRDRVKSAIINSDLSFPVKKITINLAPADMRKEGPIYDLPIALGILEASKQLPVDKTSEYGCLGELALDGRLRHMKGCLIAVLGMQKKGIEKVFLPASNAKEAALVKGIEIYPAKDLSTIIAHLKGSKLIHPISLNSLNISSCLTQNSCDFRDVIGQTLAKRALMISASGNHNLLMIGPPGSGKTMLAKCLPSILPALSSEEILEVTGIYSLAGLLDPKKGLIYDRPFRAPHHTTSEAGLVGGGSYPRPGEVSLSHRGILFLDELPEFSRRTLEVLRQPLEEGSIQIGRARFSVLFPAKILFLAAMNPCPCGYYTHPERSCRCSSYEVKRYISRISGPLLDRIDLQVEVQRLPFEHLIQNQQSPISSREMQKKVLEARKIQKERFEKEKIFTNSSMNNHQIQKFCSSTKEAKKLFKEAYRHFNLSGRSYKRILKVARTVADLDGKTIINTEHLAEVMHLRNLDKLFI